MAATFDAPAQYERDLRGANKEWKRGKDSNMKWAHGSRPSSGVGVNWLTGELTSGSESQRAKSRPLGKFSEQTNYNAWKNQQNVNKPNHGRHVAQSSGRVKSKSSTLEEIEEASGSRSIIEMLPATAARQKSVSDNVLYSFDRAETTPGKPLTLDVFIKPANARETEKFVAKEYEILDSHGDAVKGRKARQTLRKAASSGAVPEEESLEVEDGFELV